MRHLSLNQDSGGSENAGLCILCHPLFRRFVILLSRRTDHSHSIFIKHQKIVLMEQTSRVHLREKKKSKAVDLSVSSQSPVNGLFASSSSLSSSLVSKSSSSSGYCSSQEPLRKRETHKKYRETKYSKEATTESTDEQESQRQRNNVAVRKSRENAKRKSSEILLKIEQFTKENAELELGVEILGKEAKLIRAMYAAHINVGHGLILAEGDLISPEDRIAVAAVKDMNK